MRGKLIGLGLGVLALANYASAVDYDPATDITAIGTKFQTYVAAGVVVIVAALGAGLAIAAVVWVFNKVRAKLFGR